MVSFKYFFLPKDSNMMRVVVVLLYTVVLLFSTFTTTTVYAQLNNVGTLEEISNQVSRFINQLDKAGISPSIGSTIIAPSNVAYERFENDGTGRWQRYTQQVEYFIHFRDLHLWHLITEDGYSIEEIFNGNRLSLENGIGNITINQLSRTLDGVSENQITTTDIETSQGMIHITDQLILPPHLGMDMIGNLLDDKTHWKFAFTTMANIALWAELDDDLNRAYENGLTFLCPPNRRFVRAQIDVPLLLTEEMRPYTVQFVKSHMIEQIYTEASIFASNEANDIEQFVETTVAGTNIWITTTGDNDHIQVQNRKGPRVRFQANEVLVFDQTTDYSIFHGIDLPLLPPMASDFVEITYLTSTHDTETCFRFFRQALLSSTQIANMFNLEAVTVWCPTNTAFEFWNNEDRNRLLEPIWVRHATEFLLNHMNAGALSRPDFVAQAPSFITMLNGATYELRKSGPRPRIKTPREQARSDFGDLIAIDGYMHVIDTVLTPTAVSQSIYDKSDLDPDFSLLVTNIDFVDLQDLVDRDLPLTMLAPNNDAWRRVEIGVFDGDDVILRHIFRGLLFTDVIANETQLTSVNGITSGVELRGVDGEHLFVGNAYVYEGDILARNGVLHHIDRLIGEVYPTSTPTISPAPTITAQPTAYIPPTPAPVPVSGPAVITFQPQYIPEPTAVVQPTRPDGNADSSASYFSMFVILFGTIFTTAAITVIL